MAQGKIGRPKNKQTKPLIFERVRGRVERTVSMSPKTADDLDRYIAWAAGQVGATEDEAMTLTIDQALGLWFQRDQLFRESLEDKTESGSGGAPKASSPSSSPAAPKPGLLASSTPSRPGAPS